MAEQIQFSHSRVGTYLDCPRKYKYSYIDKLKPFPNYDANNALICGTTMHTGIETDLETAIQQYVNSFPIITDEHINEIIKFEYLIPIAKETFPNGLYETKIDLPEFVGYIDLLVPIDENTYDMYDFKYSNNINGYMTSGQLHEYKYYFEKANPNKKIRNLYFGFIPKVNIKPKKNESLIQFRDRIKAELKKSNFNIKQVEYDEQKVKDFIESTTLIKNATTFPATYCWLCERFCEFRNYCQRGEDVDIMNLPKNERRNIEKIEKKVIWLYGAPFSGKTYLANKFPDPLMLNTDGNIRFVDAPYIAIKDEVSVTGRLTKRTFAWQVFKDAIAELEKKQNTFKTIVLDLVEDAYEHCRIYMYDQLGITHESDDSFRAWDKVRIEFLSTMKRLTNLEYENVILISHEDTSKDITKKTGDKITAIKPNLQEKAALKISGMVDIVARVIADDNGRVLSFKANDIVFGGGRLNITSTEIPCDYDALMEVYDEANKTKETTETKVEKPKRKSKKEEVVEETEEVHAKFDVTEEVVAEVTKVIEEAEKAGIEVETPTVEEDKPAAEEPRRYRKRKTDSDAPKVDTTQYYIITPEKNVVDVLGLSNLELAISQGCVQITKEQYDDYKKGLLTVTDDLKLVEKTLEEKVAEFKLPTRKSRGEVNAQPTQQVEENKAVEEAQEETTTRRRRRRVE